MPATANLDACGVRDGTSRSRVRHRLAARRASDAPVDWAALCELRVPAAFLRMWAGRSAVALYLHDPRGRVVGRFGPKGDAVCAGDCGATASAGEAGVVACLRTPGLHHLVAAIVLDGDRPAGVAVSGSFARGPGGGDVPAMEPALVALLVRLLEVAIGEMGVYWRSKRTRVGRAALDRIFGRSAAIEAVRRAIPRLARTERTVLVAGETGTGKELVAHALHALSRRAGGPFVVLQCAAVPESLLESQLFGHERGAFTGAVEGRRGLFELAGGGTLFLDEVSSMSPALQGRLLRVLEEGSVVRVGGAEPVPVDVRVVAATNRDLGEMVREGRFRDDLFYRLHVLTISLPPLREREGDIARLAALFAARASAEEGEPGKAIEPEALAALEAYPWPGNVRELAHAIERAVVGCRGDRVRLEDLPAEVRRAVPAAPPGGESISFRERKQAAVAAWERAFLARELRASGGNQSALARRIRMSRSKLGEKLRRYGLTGG